MAEKTDKPTQQKRSFECRVATVPGVDRTLRFIASTERVARDGEIIRVAGWETENFEKNPVFLWSHDHETPPIGRVVRTKKIAKPKDGSEPRFEIDVQFAGLEQLHEMAEQVYLLYRDGFLNAVSVGYMPLEYQDLTDDQKKTLGLDAWGRVIKRADLWEVSAVGVPADPGAVLIADPEDRAAARELLLSVRSAMPEPEQERLDALADSLDDEPEPEPSAGTATLDVGIHDHETSDLILAELRSIRERVERLSPPTQTPEPAPERAPADDPEALAPPPAPASPAAPETDFYGLLDAITNKKGPNR